MNTFEIVTALTVITIGTIILLYFIVLKRKGWLTEESSHENSYLCPNPKCRKIFQKPITLTDLSTTPPRGYLACPHCGLDLETVSVVKPKESQIDEKILSLKKLQLSTENPTVRTENSKLETPVGMKIPETTEVSKSTFLVGISKGLRKRAALPESKSLDQALEIEDAPLSKPVEKPPKLQEVEKSSQSSRECPHFFGYVKTLPKNNPIPDECLGCSWIVECLTQAEKVQV